LFDAEARIWWTWRFQATAVISCNRWLRGPGVNGCFSKLFISQMNKSAFVEPVTRSPLPPGLQSMARTAPVWSCFRKIRAFSLHQGQTIHRFQLQFSITYRCVMRDAAFHKSTLPSSMPAAMMPYGLSVEPAPTLHQLNYLKCTCSVQFHHKWPWNKPGRAWSATQTNKAVLGRFGFVQINGKDFKFSCGWETGVHGTSYTACSQHWANAVLLLVGKRRPARRRCAVQFFQFHLLRGKIFLQKFLYKTSFSSSKTSTIILPWQ